MTSGNVQTIRLSGDYIYGERVMSEANAKAGMFRLMEAKKDGDKYVGTVNSRMRNQDGASCTTKMEWELTLVTPDRIEGRTMSPPSNAKIDWKKCTYSIPSAWQSFTWIPIE